MQLIKIRTVRREGVYVEGRGPLGTHCLFEALGGQLQAHVQQVIDTQVWSSVRWIRVVIYMMKEFEAVKIHDTAIYGAGLMKGTEEWSAR